MQMHAGDQQLVGHRHVESALAGGDRRLRIDIEGHGNLGPANLNVRHVTDIAPDQQGIRAGLQRVAKGVAQAHDLKSEVQLFPGYPVTVNDAGFVDFTRQVTERLLGDEHYAEMHAPYMGAEDFSYVLDQVPGAMVFLGVRPDQGSAAPLHSNRMILNESALSSGIALHAAMALEYLGQSAAG